MKYKKILFKKMWKLNIFKKNKLLYKKHNALKKKIIQLLTRDLVKSPVFNVKKII